MLCTLPLGHRFEMSTRIMSNLFKHVLFNVEKSKGVILLCLQFLKKSQQHQIRHPLIVHTVGSFLISRSRALKPFIPGRPYLALLSLTKPKLTRRNRHCYLFRSQSRQDKTRIIAGIRRMKLRKFV